MFIDPEVLERARLEQLLANTTPRSNWTPEEYEARLQVLLDRLHALAKVRKLPDIPGALRALTDDIQRFLEADAPHHWRSRGFERSVVDAILEEVCARFQEATRLVVFRLSERNLRIKVTERTIIQALELELQRLGTTLGDAGIGLDIAMDCQGDEELARRLSRA